MLDLNPINIISHNRRDSSSYISILEILDMYDLEGLNYKIWTPFINGSFSKGKTIHYKSNDLKLQRGNLFRLDILVFELQTTIHPIYINKYVDLIREFFDGIIIFVGENIDGDFKYLLDNFKYPIYYIKSIEIEDYPIYHYSKNIVRGYLDSSIIEDSDGNIQTIDSWKIAFIRDRKLSSILNKGNNLDS